MHPLTPQSGPLVTAARAPSQPPPALSGRSREQLVPLAACAFVPIGLLHALMMRIGLEGAAFMGVFWGVAIAAFIPILRRLTPSAAITANALLLTILGTFAYEVYAFGGRESPAMLWLPFVPVLAAVTLGRKSSIAWSFAALAVLSIFFLPPAAGLVSTRTAPPMMGIYEWLNQALLLASAVGLGAAITPYRRTTTSSPCDRPIAERMDVYSQNAEPPVVAAATTDSIEKQLRESEDRYRLMTENVQDLFCTVSVTGRLIYCSPVVKEFGGYDPDEVIGTHITRYFADSADKRRAMKILRLADGEQPLSSLEFLYKPKHGEPFHAEVRGKPLVVDGRVVAIHCVLRNIAERKRAELAIVGRRDELAASLERERRTSRALEEAVRNLEKARRQAQTAALAKSEFLANMSHEIRTPMTAIMGYIELLAESCPEQCDFGKGERNTQINTISRNARHLLQLLNDILDISKIEAGKLEIERIACSPVEIIAEVVSMMKTRAEHKNLHMVVRCSGPVPTTIRSDPTRLRQILFNLLGNAVKFTYRGDVSVIVCVEELDGEPRLIIEVRDTGIGIAPEHLPRIFQTFSQGDASTTRRFGGTGLGLAISRRLAEMLGGDISVESTQGQGTSFRISIATGPLDEAEFTQTIPCEPDANGEPAMTLATPRLSEPAVTPYIEPPPIVEQPRRVLVVEDGVDNQRLIAVILRKIGVEVAVAEHGRQAMIMMHAARDGGEPFDLVLMDMQMPVMDGYEATRCLRTDGFDLPIIALTAHAMASDRDKCIAAGCDDYATKPIQRQRLIDLVTRHLNREPALAV